MSKMYLLKPGFAEDSVIYEIQLKEVARLSEATVDEVDQKLEDMGVTQLVIDAGYPQIIERLRRKRMVRKLMRRKTTKQRSR